MDRETVLSSRILIVDDQDANVLLMERVLQQAGYKNYLSVTDSRKVLDQFRVFQPDLVLLDLMMPKLDGYAVIKQLRGWMADDIYIPILVITADASRTAKQKALSLGAKDFLTKPIDTAEAMLRIYNLLETRSLYRQLHFCKQLLVENVLESQICARAASDELDRIAGAGRISVDVLLELRTALDRSAAAIGKLVRMTDPGDSPVRASDEQNGVEFAPAM